jgi:hypothetical protein
MGRMRTGRSIAGHDGLLAFKMPEKTSLWQRFNCSNFSR